MGQKSGGGGGDNTANQMKAAMEAAAAAQAAALAAAKEMQEKSIKAAKESIANIQQATGKTAKQYVEEAQQAYGTIIPGITTEYKAKLAAYDPEKVLKPFSASATAGVQQAGEYMGEKVKADVAEYGGMLATGATLAGQKLSEFSKQAAKQQKQAFKTFQKAATGAQEQGLAQSYAITKGLSNLYNPEYQALMGSLPTKLSKSTVLEETMAKSLYPNV